MLVVGVDHNTKEIDCSMYDTLQDKFVLFESIFAPGRTAEDRFPTLASMWINFVGNHNSLDYFVVEDVIIGPNSKSAIAQAKILGMIQTVLLVHGKKFIIVSPASWKKFVIGKGNATKDEIADYLYTVKPELEKSNLTQDMVDASALSLYGVKSLKV